MVLRHVCCKTVSGFEDLITHPALDESDRKGEMVSFKVLAHVAGVLGDLAAEETRPGPLFNLTRVTREEGFKVGLAAHPCDTGRLS